MRENQENAVDAATAQALLDTEPDRDRTHLFVDVRTPGEYQTAHIPGAINLPMDQLTANLDRIVSEAGGRLVLVCQSGARAEQCRTRLADAGLSTATVLNGGMGAWTAAGGPVVHGEQRWSLERQVRLVAGLIVLVSVLASIAWEPAKYVAAFIGAGLTFAALTNTCGMAILLSKLPYNRPATSEDVETSLQRLRGETS
ncbi:rhodanese-like domain-containing protein [Lipingzhangella sp. LS1_29]|uniref:Rhodanese-like domain-containing protein n=1 Tax=Lipingzhangella rawalii TaxID=2055835 RepID=A0ABU2H2Y1_9ACTN|nr:rhodanese-like domain-containing protein [Lipingzhangella rawalii]MDS1269658.1 rhodanese-like domain-containing protein [Lipingzhangella rawalii]